MSRFSVRQTCLDVLKFNAALFCPKSSFAKRLRSWCTSKKNANPLLEMPRDDNLK